MAASWKLIIACEGQDPTAARVQLFNIFRESSANIELLTFDPRNPSEIIVKGSGTLTSDLKALGRRPS